MSNWVTFRMFVAKADEVDASIGYELFRAKRNEAGKIESLQVLATQNFTIPYSAANLAAEIEGALRADPEAQIATVNIQKIQLRWWVDNMHQGTIDSAQEVVDKSDLNALSKLKELEESNPTAFKKAGYRRISDEEGS